jgi:hypothetical protein
MDIYISLQHHLYDYWTRKYYMHETFLHHQAADKSDSINASGMLTTSRPAMSQPVAFILIIAPQQACNFLK